MKDYERVRCTVCKKKSEQRIMKVFHTSNSYLYCYNLKILSVEEQKTFVQVCPNCGLALGRIDENIMGITKRILTSELYQFEDGAMTSLSISLTKAAVVYEHLVCLKLSGIYYVYAGLTETNSAVKEQNYIKVALAFDRYHRKSNLPDADLDLILLETDVCRRAGLFAAAYERLALCGELEGMLKIILKAEKRLIENRDKGEYLYEELLKC